MAKTKPKEPCEHHYPYFLRWYDDLSKSSKMIERHCYCFKCEKEYIIKLHPKTFGVGLMNLGLEKGRETIEKLRKQLPNIIKEYNINTKKKEANQK